MSISERLLGINELAIKKKWTKIQTAAFNRFLVINNKKQYQTVEDWETLIKEFITR